MDLWKLKTSGGASASSLSVAPLSVPNQVDDISRSPKDMRAVGHTNVDVDIREVYFLIMHFLSAGPCQKTFAQFRTELLEHQLLPRRYHAWFSRSGVPSEGDVDDNDGTSLPLDYNKLMDRYPHVAKDHLVKLLKQLMLSTVHPLHGNLGQSSPSAADVPTLLGYGSFSLLVDRISSVKQSKSPAVYLRWPHMPANLVQGLSLRETGGGFTKHHRAPSIRSACYAIAKPSTMVQRIQNIKKLRGHRVSVYCAIFDRSGRYVISGSDDRLVKIWSMETAFCLASCRGHEGDITDLAVSSNNALVASSSNDFVIRVWRLPDGMQMSVLRGHTGAVTAIAFSPRPSAVYQLLTSSDDGTCRLWDARYSQRNPRIYMPKPSDATTGQTNASCSVNRPGKSNAPPTNQPSSSNGQQRYQILCCAYNANGTVFVTGSSDTYARVWSAFNFKPNSDDSDQPIHEMDVLTGHENDVNNVQFSGCSVASKYLTSDSLKEENTMKFRNSWFCHDNIVTCSRDGSAIIWVPRSRRSHGKALRWTRAYHLKVPPPPLPPQPPRGGPRKRFLPTPRGVDMIVWSLDNRFILAAITDCRICVWNAIDGSLVHSLTGHTASSYVLDVHPFNPRIAMSAGYDGRTIVWDIWEGVPIRTYEIGRFKLVDGKFSPDGTSIVLSDDVGQIYFLNTGQGESQKDAKYDQFFLGDYRPLIHDTQGNVLDQETQLPPHRRNMQEPLCDSSMVPYPEPYQSQFQQRRLGALGIEWRPSMIKCAVGPDFSVGLDYPVIPLADLDGMLEPQPQFIDAMFWEPEFDIVVSDDNDSEYNVNEDRSSAGEQGSVSAISSSDSECSEDDCSNRDGLRRSRRKRHNIEGEAMTFSGRHASKRNLNECDGNPSGSNRAKKKSKGVSKSSKMKYPKAKTLRPQRVAARNARNMFSQISDTDGEHDISKDDSSDSLEDLDILSESERKMHNKHELKEPLFGNVAKPPAHSESQVKVEKKLGLVLKISLRDSKKNVPLEDTGLACETQANMTCQSSRPQKSDQETSAEVTNAKLLQSHNTDENTDKSLDESNHLDTSITVEGNTCRQTYRLSRSGNGFQSDIEFDGHHGYNGNRRSYHMSRKFDPVGSMIDTEPADLDNTLKVSSVETSLLGDHDGSLTSGYKLNDVDKGQPGSKKCTEDIVESNEVVHSSHSRDLKMKAPMKAMKLVIKKKQLLTDNEGPCKLKFVSSQADSTGARTDLISGNSSFTRPNLVMEVPEEAEHDIKICSPQLLHSYSGGKSYDHAHESNKSCKGEVWPDGSGCDLKENNLIFSNQHGFGIGPSDVASDPRCRTRSMRMETASEKPNALNLRIKVRQGQNSRGMCSLEGSSVNVPDQLHQRKRASRNRHDEYIANDPGILTRRMSNLNEKKVSWLMLSEQEEGYRFIPQLGDEVVYMRQGHQEYIESFMLKELGPWKLFKGLSASEICKVEELEYAVLPGSGDSCCKLKLRFVDPSSHVHGKLFRLTLPELINFADFVVEKTWYDTAINRNWSSRDKCLVWWRNEDGKSGSWWDGRIIAVQAKSHDFPDSPWERYQVQYRTDLTETHLHSPWELYDPEIQWEHPHIDPEIRDTLLSYFTKLDHRGYDIQVLDQLSEKSEFSNRFPVQLYPELIQTRLKNDYYRRVEAIKHDIMVMLSSAEEYFRMSKNAHYSTMVRRMSVWFRRKLDML
ncbi:PREDICTED: bromodomain and WD repeat-containing protein 3-like isoform X1 [Lupinus angustifolius]|uniref:bromodomain and WD repeat-containing protein 3-like isoform X1 n=1 Tax=Lupinus angustifolius TaxID=3871 RepID=UPI00092ED94D|nr:PREDICTED: bromodomain and WD repeat-containing protein 3-like isoform X1 [Lupinus angustifolius]